MKRLFSLVIIFLLILLTVTAVNRHDRQIQESITYFPLHPDVSFKAAYTSLSLNKKGQSGNYFLRWQTTSTLDRKAYLRQDAALLFANGKLIGKLGDWRQNTDQISQEAKVDVNNNTLFQAITFHYAELHEKNQQIFSSQAISADQLYVVKVAEQQLHSFKNASANNEINWKTSLEQHTKLLLKYSWGKGIRFFAINLNRYHPFPLTQLAAVRVFPGFSEQETSRVMGNLWEGLYKNYFLGIKKADGTITNPIGSTIPLILLASDKSHLLVLTETLKGKPILLRQMIESGR